MNDRKPMTRGLGRGLSALMADVNAGLDSPAAQPPRPDTRLPIESLAPNPAQPRRSFSPEALQDLTDSIRQKGVLQPLIVRPTGTQGRYEIVAGERRWRAAQAAGLHEVPVLVRALDDVEVLEIALIENIQRADLNPIEEAAAFRMLMDRFGHTQEKLAEALSKSRSHIANLLRLLSLPVGVQDMVRDGALSAGHARALVTVPDAAALARQIVEKGLSVRETEALVRKPDQAQRRRTGQRGTSEKDADTRALEADLSATLGMKVSIDQDASGESGVLTVRYETLEALDALCRVLTIGGKGGRFGD
jgi:ParB family chromosome partitioning protein